MQKWESEAIILTAKKFSERDLLVNLFAKGQGLHAGIVKGGQGKNKLSIYQPGNLVIANWSARLSDQLGTFTAEISEPIFAKLMSERKKLQALLSITCLLRDSLAERDEHDDLYVVLLEFFNYLTTAQNWFVDYIKFEIELLRILGFGLDLSECAVTGLTSGLEYISPKSGRAVTAQGATGYENKLLPLPKFFLTSEEPDAEQLQDAIKVTTYFLENNIYSPQHKHLPDERARLLEMFIPQ